MYLLERFLGVFTYTAVLLLVCFLIIKMPKKKIGKILLFYTIALSIIGFLYKPTSGADLSRIIPIMHSYAKLDFNGIIERFFNTSTPFAMIYYSVIGKLGIDSLLPAITTFLVYNNIFYVFRKYIKKNQDIDNKYVATTLFFIMSTGAFIEVISGIRMMLAFSILLRCVYNENYEGKSVIVNIPLYIVASLIHTSAIVLFIIRVLIYIILEKKKKKYRLIKKIILIFALLFLYLIIGNIYISKMFDKAEYYFNEGTYFYIWDFIKTYILLISIIITTFYYKKYIKTTYDYDIKSNNYTMNFSIILTFIAIIVSLQEFSTFYRFTYFNTMLNIPIILNCLKLDNNLKRKNNYLKLIMLLSLVTLSIAITRGGLSSLKFF